MMQYWSRLRQPALFAAGLSILFVLLVAACGGGDGDDGGPAPAATAAPQATAAPATQPPAATPAAPAAGQSSSGSEKLFIPASEAGEILVTLAAGDVLELTFNVVSNITGGQNVTAGIGQAAEGIQLVISDPVGTQLLTIDETLVTDTVEITAEVDGEHQIVFFNPFLLQAVSVEASWEINP